MNLTPKDPPTPDLSSATAGVLELGSLRLRHCDAWSGVDGAQWDALEHGASPFTRAGFLSALEDSASVGAKAGWEPHYLLVEALLPPDADSDSDSDADAQAQRPHERQLENFGSKPASSLSVSAKTECEPPRRLVGALAVYRKNHSYGEYIFDWSWARGSHQAGIPYYPKLVVAAPMTPATGARLLVLPGLSQGAEKAVRSLLLAGLRELETELGCSSTHVLFCDQNESEIWRAEGFEIRKTFQFHWHNQEYAEFDDFLGALVSRRRKQIKKERRKAQAGLEEVEWIAGADMDKHRCDQAYQLYLETVSAYGSSPYLTPEFFELCPSRMGERWQWALAKDAEQDLGAALFFEGPDTLFGRYWGAQVHRDCLHFELAYYRGIERCLQRGLSRFEAGAQGEHKLLRGFVPTATYSAHRIVHPGLRKAVGQAIAQQNREQSRMIEALGEHAQYRKAEG